MCTFFKIQLEEEELEEFELLEQAAANASFSSNSSVVVKVLAKARGSKQLRGSSCWISNAPFIHFHVFTELFYTFMYCLMHALPWLFQNLKINSGWEKKNAFTGDQVFENNSLRLWSTMTGLN